MKTTNNDFRYFNVKIPKIIFSILAVLFFSSCDKYTVQEPIYITDVQKAYEYSDEYYENLRNYKKSDHQIFFSWIPVNANTPSWGVHPWGLPDSIDIVSLWGVDLDENTLRAIDSTRRIKGTRFVDCRIIGISEFFKDFPEGLSIKESNILAANRIVNHVYKYGLDGFDIDFEPYVFPDTTAIKYLGRAEDLTVFIKELGRFLGPKSGTGKLLIIDGELNHVPIGLGEYFDYFVSQSYYETRPSAYQNRYEAVKQNIPPHKFIVTEEWQTSYGNLYDDDSPFTATGPIPSILGMARWQPHQGRKGGIGTFHGETDYGPNSQYNLTRQAIQIMNPAAK